MQWNKENSRRNKYQNKPNDICENSKNNISVMPGQIKKVPLIIKPKERQNAKKSKEELNIKVDPVNLKISSVENRKNGTLVIQTEKDEERIEITSAIEKEMSEGYE